ncbi:hypothetical protein LDC_1136 [sediment metagenome]|uniref:Uncharacterized protein n=1 Tax=sediment metagenome TaxID=749907 RepID=D9PHY2_9ZZZZ
MVNDNFLYSIAPRFFKKYNANSVDRIPCNIIAANAPLTPTLPITTKRIVKKKKNRLSATDNIAKYLYSFIAVRSGINDNENSEKGIVNRANIKEKCSALEKKEKSNCKTV